MTPFPIQSSQHLAERMVRRLTEGDRPPAVSREVLHVVTGAELLILLGLRRARFASRSLLRPPVHPPPKSPDSGEKPISGAEKSGRNSLSPDSPKPKSNPKNRGTQNSGGTDHGTEE